jgi:hypothetical protein
MKSGEVDEDYKACNSKKSFAQAIEWYGSNQQYLFQEAQYILDEVCFG